MNIFRQAKQLREKIDSGSELTEEEEKLLGAALIPLMQLPEYNYTPIAEGLEELAKMVEGIRATQRK